MHSNRRHVNPTCHWWRKALRLRRFRKRDNDFSSHEPLRGQHLAKQRTCAAQMTQRAAGRLFLIGSSTWTQISGRGKSTVSEQRRPPRLPSSLSRLWSANRIVSERSLHLFSSEVSRPPCDAFTRIYKVCNLPCVGFLIFWITEIKHALLLGGILLDSHAFFCLW